ncbi:HTH-type transcriptional regulator YesS [compost metagenome]
MTFASGIDLARYVYDHKLNTKVVILSGFQEFALAREAIRYNVSHYLLKPTDLDEVAGVFCKIAKELEDEKREREQILKQNQHVKTLRPLLMEQFFSNLLFGGGWKKDGEELERKLRQLGLPVDPAKGLICMMTVDWSAPSGDQHAIRRPEERQSLNVAITKERDQVHYTCIHIEGSRFVIVGNALVGCSANDFQKRAEQYFLHIQSTMSSLLGLSIRLERMELYPSLLELLARHSEAPPTEEADQMTTDPAYEVPDQDRIIIRHAKKFIAEHFEMDLTLTEVSRHIGLNPVYFSRLFKQETGETYSDYVIDVRIRKAMDYLKDPKYKVYEIGFLVGYKNTKYFHKLFKRQTGLTPSEYRDQL